MNARDVGIDGVSGAEVGWNFDFWLMACPADEYRATRDSVCERVDDTMKTAMVDSALVSMQLVQ